MRCGRGHETRAQKGDEPLLPCGCVLADASAETLQEFGVTVEQRDVYLAELKKLAEERRRAALKEIADSVREHCALLDDAVLGQYIGAAAAQLALRHDDTPRGAIEAMLDAGAFDPKAWGLKRRALDNFSKVTRQRYVGAALSLVPRDHGQN